MSLKYSFPLFDYATKIIKALFGPKYDGKYLHSVIKEKLGRTFDIKRLQPTIFSSYEVKLIIFSLAQT